ncbi:hypothetical protein E2I00_008388 [Balaenoptera physalus]|uniref:Uncharacterized protein n=1 Tax=Balaenoptera physalus TaxID=9770 RepID=A0A643BLL7_BALPH|nr:hypothetical protein E2I00_008388 [Balaenoptera physalus]
MFLDPTTFSHQTPKTRVPRPLNCFSLTSRTSSHPLAKTAFDLNRFQLVKRKRSQFPTYVSYTYNQEITTKSKQ